MQDFQFSTDQANRTNSLEKKHNLTLTCRRELVLDGIVGVTGFDENSVSLTTALGRMIVDGSELHITKMSLESGEVTVSGKINGIFYETDGEPKKAGIFGRLFR